MRQFLMVAILVSGGCVLASPALAAPPEPVSPAGAVEQRCPTFSWSAVPGASGYELLVYDVSTGAEAEEPTLSARLPAGAVAWTPGGSCLTAGGRYAWTVRARGDGEGAAAWSEPALFDVAGAPSLDEVQAALATLRRYMAGSRGGEAGAREAEGGGPTGGERPAARRPSPAAVPRAATAAPGPAGTTAEAAATGVLEPEAAPTLGSPSLSVDANIALGAASNMFKDGAVFLWDDTTGNLALGRLALASATGTATRNTAVGREALRYTEAGSGPGDLSENTAVGYFALRANTTGRHNTATGSGALQANTTGYLNTGIGVDALRSNTEGESNTAVGAEALYSNVTGGQNTATGFQVLRSNTTGINNSAHGALALSSNTVGYGNTAMGARALQNVTDGDRNVAVGYSAGTNVTSGNDNIHIANEGVSGDSAKIRIGAQGTQTQAFIAGIRGATTANADAVTVVIDSAGQLGTVSSSRAVKQDVRDIDALAKRLLELRPVAFRYREHAARDPDTPLQFGLIAEEVAEVFPELVVRDEEGRPQTVKYHLLSALLLEELQRADAELVDQGAELEALRRELAALEAERPAAEGGR